MLSQLLLIIAITFAVFVLFFLFMGIGYMVKKQPLKGSCGGVANLMGDEYCQFCGNDPNKCDSLNNDNNALNNTQNEQTTKQSQQRQKAKELGKAV